MACPECAAQVAVDDIGTHRQWHETVWKFWDAIKTLADAAAMVPDLIEAQIRLQS